jgi:hypothetical protein
MRTAGRDAESGQLVVAPERPVGEHEIARGEPGEHRLVPSGQSGRVAGDAAAVAVAEHEAARIVVANRERLDDEARAIERPGVPRLERLPVDPAEALEHAQQRLAQRALDAGTAEDAHRRSGLPQQQQPGRVVDLRVGEQDARNRRRADAGDARGRQRLELLTRVRRGVDEVPGPLVPADRQR